MTPHKLNRGASALACAVTVVAVAACGGSSTTSTTKAAASAARPSHGTVNVASTGLGKILVDSTGRTVYLFEADSGTISKCYGACAVAWPPLLTTGRPTPGAGAQTSLVGVTRRSDGSRQVTYNGHPLYRFVSDTKPGETTGQGVNGSGALWFVLSSVGDPITNQQASTGAGSGGNASPY